MEIETMQFEEPRMINKTPSDNNTGHYNSVLDDINLFGIPVIVTLGIVGNGVSFLVFVLTPLRHKSSSVYLACMNVADTGFLLSLLPVWLGWVHIHVFHIQVICQISVFATYFFGFMSVWVVVSFTVERYIVVFHPLRRSSLCTVKKAMVTMVILTCVALLIYSYNWWSLSVQIHESMPICQARPHFMKLVLIMSGVDTVITLVVPSLLLIVLNVSIIVKLYLYHNMRRQSLRVNQFTKTSSRKLLSTDTQATLVEDRSATCLTEAMAMNNTRFTNGFKGRQMSAGRVFPRRNASMVSTSTSSSSSSAPHSNFHVKTTSSLIIVSTVFLLLNLPSHAFRVSISVLEQLGRQVDLTDVTNNIIHQVCQLLYYSNFAANFFLYIATSTCFREALASLCRRITCRT